MSVKLAGKRQNIRHTIDIQFWPTLHMTCHMRHAVNTTTSEATYSIAEQHKGK